MKSILITGCGSGIGESAAHLLQSRGYQVFATARKNADVDKLKSEGIESVQLDINDAISMQRALDSILEKTGGKLDVLFNNAGFLQAGAIEDLTRDMIRAQFETNVFGPIELIRLVLPIMRRQGHGRIIQNSSILGVITLPYYGAYNASKFALEGFTRTLRQELKGTNISVSLINPGPITSQLRANAHRCYQETITSLPETHHRASYQQMEATYFKPSKTDQRLTLPPEAVVDQLIQAIENKRPKLHYFVGLPAQALALLQRLLPERLFESLLSYMSRR